MGLVTSEVAAQCCYGKANEDDIAEEKAMLDHEQYTATDSLQPRDYRNGQNGRSIFEDEEDAIDINEDDDDDDNDIINDHFWADPKWPDILQHGNPIDFNGDIWSILDSLFTSYHSESDNVKMQKLKDLLTRNVDEFGTQTLYQNMKNIVNHCTETMTMKKKEADGRIVQFERNLFPFQLARFAIGDFTKKGGYRGMYKMEALPFDALSKIVSMKQKEDKAPIYQVVRGKSGSAKMRRNKKMVFFADDTESRLAAEYLFGGTQWSPLLRTKVFFAFLCLGEHEMATNKNCEVHT